MTWLSDEVRWFLDYTCLADQLEISTSAHVKEVNQWDFSEILSHHPTYTTTPQMYMYIHYASINRICDAIMCQYIKYLYYYMLY